MLTRQDVQCLSGEIALWQHLLAWRHHQSHQCSNRSESNDPSRWSSGGYFLAFGCLCCGGCGRQVPSAWVHSEQASTWLRWYRNRHNIPRTLFDCYCETLEPLRVTLFQAVVSKGKLEVGWVMLRALEKIIRTTHAFWFQLLWSMNVCTPAYQRAKNFRSCNFPSASIATPFLLLFLSKHQVFVALILRHSRTWGRLL